MSIKLQLRRGLETNLPTLAVGEPGFCTDSYKLFIGSAAGNVQIAKQTDLTVGLALKAPLASPTFTGTVKIPDALSDNDGIIFQVSPYGAGTYITTVGVFAGQVSPKNSFTGMGYGAGANNLGLYVNGFGREVVINNTASFVNGFGCYALQDNVGAEANAHGHAALMHNTADYCDGFGHSALMWNTGAMSVGFGGDALWHNKGEGASALGNSAGQLNIGVGFTGVGNYAGMTNEGTNNIFIGSSPANVFNDNAAAQKTFAGTDVNVSTQVITITSHGFGANGTYRNLRFTQGTGTITGLIDQIILQVKILTANTVQLEGADVSAPTGTGHIFTPQTIYSNVTVIGVNTVPTKSNQIVIGNSSVTECFLYGTPHFVLASIAAYANNAAAQAGGLAVGDVYRTNADPSVLCIRSA